MKDFGIYIHIPFCRQKCFYCDFPSFAGKEKMIEPYLEALEQELGQVRRRLSEAGEAVFGSDGKLAPQTLYIGGGTPTVLETVALPDVFYLLQKHIDVENIGEITIEANPGTVDGEKLRLLRQFGISRLSLGVQSFDDGCLRAMGRIHSGQEALAAVAEAQAAGFGNISVDLMYGLPGQDMKILQESVETALALGVQHISIYGLQLEAGTAFDKMQQQGRLILPSDELTEKMYDYITAVLPERGYQRYEISNFALPGRESRHNLSYWQDVPYLGFGSGAHSYWGDCRYQNPARIEVYMEEIFQGRAMCHIEERLTEKAHMEEFCFLALRTSAGISVRRFAAVFGRDVHEVYGETVSRLVQLGLLAEDGERICLSQSGMKYGNQVFAEFLLPDA
ncbi:radical SAM family heme chaperone HemW [Anaerovibrio sp.]|uniref:radical SAM family heme chaperone HemW n=1 Tax=Anaerovibrio sp. TaxID=1872532 RepID=UPI003F1587CE